MFDFKETYNGLLGPENLDEDSRRELDELSRRVEMLSPLQKAIIFHGKEYLGGEYDTTPDGSDGFASLNPDSSGRYRVRNNVTGRVRTVSQRPMVCIDYVVQTLADAGVPMMEELVDDGFIESGARRTSEVEQVMLRSNDFESRRLDINYDYPSGLERPFRASVGDVITTRNRDSGSRHIGIVSEVDSNGLPTRMMHSSGGNGIAETPFLNTRRHNSVDGGNRYDGFFGRRTRIDYIFTPLHGGEDFENERQIDVRLVNMDLDEEGSGESEFVLQEPVEVAEVETEPSAMHSVFEVADVDAGVMLGPEEPEEPVLVAQLDELDQVRLIEAEEERILREYLESVR